MTLRGHLPTISKCIAIGCTLFGSPSAESLLEVRLWAEPKTEPTTTPKPAEPTTTPKPAEPTTTPKPAEPTTTPKPAEPTTTPKPAEPTTTPKPAEPTATPKPAKRPRTRSAVSPTGKSRPTEGGSTLGNPGGAPPSGFTPTSATSPRTSKPEQKFVSSLKPPPKTGVITGIPVISEEALMIELSVTDANHFQNNVQLLKNLVDETLSTKELRQIEERCQPFLDPSMNSSMLQPSNLPCIPLVIKKRVELTTIETSSKRNQRTRSWKTIRNNEDWNAFCGQNFSAAFQSLNVSKIEELQPFVSFFTQDASNCRSRHAGAAIIAQAESFLPSTEARSLIDNIYEEIKPCMRPNDDGFERTNLRVGLLRLAFNDFARAKQALQKAALSNDPKEEQRSLFWLGAIDAYEKGDPKGQIPKVEYWNLLIRRYPLELHSVLVSQILGIDPLKRVISAKPMQWRRRSDTGIDDVDLANLVTEILIAKDAIPTAQHWLNFEQRYVDSPVPEKLLYLGILANRVQSHRESIYYFSRYLRESRTETVSPEFLDLYFPRVFSDVILANSGDIDPVLLFALIRQESAFNRKARSHADARGLMQLLPATANRYRRISKDQLFNPETNVQIGTQFIDNLFERYEGRVEHILSAYNAGPAKITRWQERTPIANQLLFSDLIPYRETRFYVSSILRNAYWYGRILTSRNDSIATETMEKSRKSRWKSALVNKLLSSVWSPTPDASGEKPDLLQFINFHQNTDASSRQKPVILRDLIQELPDFSELDELHKKESDQ